MNTAQKVREHKQTWPEMYCTNRACLWRVKHNGRPDTPCPRHMGGAVNPAHVTVTGPHHVTGIDTERTP